MMPPGDQSPETMIRGVSGQSRKLRIDLGPLRLYGDLTVPDTIRGLVLFARGNDSDRSSPQDRFIASKLNEAGLGTFMFSLLTPEEQQQPGLHTHRYRFDVPSLAGRLVEVTDWVERQLATGRNNLLENLPLGYFGTATGAACVLIAASQCPASVKAVVSRNGRPDLAYHALPQVQVPTLFLVDDPDKIPAHLNEAAMERLPASTPKEMIVLYGSVRTPGNFGTSEQIAGHSVCWFENFLA